MMNFRTRVRRGDVQIGTFVKLASHQIPELLGISGLDFCVIDCEHAAFDAGTLDRMALASRAAKWPCLVRVSELDKVSIGQTLDLGFSGVMVPHVTSADAAMEAARAIRYRLGERGFSPSTRAAEYGATDARAYRQAADEQNSLWCQIEDAKALSQLDAIAAIDEVDCLFLGLADLVLSLNAESQKDRRVVEAVAATAEAGRRHRRAVGIHVGDMAEIPELLALGITTFVCGSDQTFLLAQARQIRSGLATVLGNRA